MLHCSFSAKPGSLITDDIARLFGADNDSIDGDNAITELDWRYLYFTDNIPFELQSLAIHLFPLRDPGMLRALDPDMATALEYDNGGVESFRWELELPDSWSGTEYDYADDCVTAHYRQSMESGVAFPPLLLSYSPGEGLCLVDGVHRLNAWHLLGFDGAPAVIASQVEIDVAEVIKNSPRLALDVPAIE
jgi:hypothetical protein